MWIWVHDIPLGNSWLYTSKYDFVVSVFVTVSHRSEVFENSTVNFVASRCLNFKFWNFQKFKTRSSGTGDHFTHRNVVSLQRYDVDAEVQPCLPEPRGGSDTASPWQGQLAIPTWLPVARTYRWSPGPLDNIPNPLCSPHCAEPANICWCLIPQAVKLV